MTEYIEREAAIAAIKDNKCRKCSDIGLCGNCAVLTAIKLFEALPAADVRPVVRCGECKHCVEHTIRTEMRHIGCVKSGIVERIMTGTATMARRKDGDGDV